MTTIITIPKSLDDMSFEAVFSQLAACAPEEALTIDARQCTFASPFGLTALLAVAQTRSAKPALIQPSSPEHAVYWARAGFFRHAADLYVVEGAVPAEAPTGASDVLLEVTQVAGGWEIDRIHGRAFRMFTEKLHLEARVASGLADGVAGLCGNVGQHAGRSGWIMIQVFQYKKRLGGRNAVVVAVCDSGTGMKVPLESAVMNGVGDGAFNRLRGYVHRTDGKLSVRSGTSRLALVPPWDDDVPLTENLAPFPGVQVQLTVPARV